MLCSVAPVLAQRYRFQSVPDSIHENILDAIENRQYQEAYDLQKAHQVSWQVPVMVKYAKGRSYRHYSTKPLAMLFNIFNPDFYISEYNKNQPITTYLDTAYIPLSAYALSHRNRGCSEDEYDRSEFLKCKLSHSENLEQFVITQLEMPGASQTSLFDLILISDKAEREGMLNVIRTVRDFESVKLFNKLYSKYSGQEQFIVSAEDSIQMLNTFGALDKKGVEVGASEYLSEIIRKAKTNHSYKKGYDNIYLYYNLLGDSMSIWKTQQVRAIIANDSVAVRQFYELGCQFDGDSPYNNLISFAWHLGHHDLADWMSNLEDPDNPFGGTSYHNQGIKKDPPPPYNLLKKIKVDVAGAEFDGNIQGGRIYYSSIQSTWAKSIKFVDSLNAFVIPLSKYQRKKNNPYTGTDFTFVVSNMSRKRMKLSANATNSENLRVSMTYRELVPYKKDHRYQAYLNVQLSTSLDIEKNGQHHETVEIYLKGVDQPYKLKLVFVREK